jgi:hypothetical protein
MQIISDRSESRSTTSLMTLLSWSRVWELVTVGASHCLFVTGGDKAGGAVGRHSGQEPVRGDALLAVPPLL